MNPGYRDPGHSTARKRVAMTSCALGALLVLPGCIIDRVQTMRTQVCESEDSVTFSDADGLHLTFVEPVIYVEDVRWLSRIEPFRETYEQDSLTLHYVVRKNLETAADALEVPIDLVFRNIDDHYKLAEVAVTADIPMDLTPDRIARMRASACENEPNLFKRQMTVPLAAEDIEDLPKRDDILELAGEPNWANSERTMMRYEFLISGTEENGGTMTLELEYDRAGSRLLKISSSFSRFVFSADFERGEATTSFRS